MSSPNALKQLHDFDKASPQFHKHLSNFLRSEGYRSAFRTLQDEDSAWLVEYLDSVLMSISNHASPAFQEYLHELRNICGVNEVLPKSYTLSSSLLSVGLPSVSGSAHEGTFDGSKVRIRRVIMYPEGDPYMFGIAFRRMVVVWKNLSHPSVVPLLGVTADPIQLVLGWMPDFDLTGYITAHPDADRLNLLSDVAEGLNYLHFCNFIHEDLKGPNVLVDTTGRARITDCGLALVTRNLDSVRSAPNEHGDSTRWTAPEILTNQATFSKEADVFSFAMVLIEIFTGTVPFNDKSPHAAMLATVAGERPPRPIHPAFTDALWTMTQRCWDQDARQRPQALQMLCNLISAWKRSTDRPISTDKRVSLITAIFSNRFMAKAVERLCREDAQAIVDVTDETLDSLGPRMKRKCLNALCKICGRHALLPGSFQIPLCFDESNGHPLYSGGYADVWMGKHQGCEVAVKVLRVYSASDLDKITSKFCKEVVTWKTLRHPNVLPLLGVTMGEGLFAMVSDWMVNGNINEFIKAYRDTNRFELLEGVTRGLLYIHGEGMIHGDLKGVNILVDRDGQARLADFGLLTIILDSTYSASSSTPKGAGTTRWMSPELLDPDRFGVRDGRPTRHSDCYALGMVILEVLSGKPPFPNYNGMTVMRKIVEGERPGRPEGEEGVWFTADLWGMLEQCWSFQPERRPTIDNVLRCLRRGSMAWQPLPPDPGDPVQSDGDEESDFTSSHDQSINPMDWVDPQDDYQTPVPFRNEPHSVYVGQGSHQRSPGSQQRVAELPVFSDSTNAEKAGPAQSYDLPNTLSPVPGSESAASITSAESNRSVPPPFLEELDRSTLPPEFKKEGSDWFATFNPKVKRVLDVSLVHTLPHEHDVWSVRFSADGKYLATASFDTVQIYDTETGDRICVLVDETADLGYVMSVSFSPDGKLLATVGEDNVVRIWDIAERRILNRFQGHTRAVYSLVFSPDGRFVVSGSNDCTTRIWDVTDGSSKILAITDSAGDGVTSVAISSDGRLVAAGSYDEVIWIWDARTGELLEMLRGHGSTVFTVAFTPNGRGLVSGSKDKTLKCWDVSYLANGPDSRKNSRGASKRDTLDGEEDVGTREGNSACTMDFIGHKHWVIFVAVSHDGRWVVSGSENGAVQFWDAKSGIVQLMLQGHQEEVWSIDLSPAGSLLAASSIDGQVRIWKYTTVS